MWKRRVDGGSVSGGRITLLLRIKRVCMREKARDVFCRRELLASAAFHSLPHLNTICSLTVKLVTVKRPFLYLFFLLRFLLGFRLIKGTHTCSQEEIKRLTLLTYIRDTPTSGPGELPCSNAFACVQKLFSLTCRHLQSERVYAPSTGKQKGKVCSVI